MRIQHNISALNTYRQMATNNTGASKALEKLSSGYRINRAGDDAAGLAISEKMRAQINGLTRASANAQDGVSLIQAAEGALQETHSILQRMRELTVQAANDTNETADRDAIQAELNQLTKEVDRIATTTEFNKKTLLDGSLSKSQYAQLNSGVNLSSASASPEMKSGLYIIESDKLALKATDSSKFALTGVVAGLADQGDYLKLDFKEMGIKSPLIIDAKDFQGLTDPQANALIAQRASTYINSQTDALYTATFATDTVTFTAKEAGAVTTGASISVSEGVATTALGATTVTPGSGTLKTGQDATFKVTYKENVETSTTVDMTAKGKFDAKSKMLTITDAGSTLNLIVDDPADVTAQSATIAKGSALTLQVGANSGTSQTINISVENLSAVGLGINSLDVSTHKSSQSALDAVESAITKVSTQRAGLGAVQNRLEHTVANLDTVAENMQAAESRIRDVDMAKEMMNFTKFNILMQASQAMMAQANAQPQGVLQLLR